MTKSKKMIIGTLPFVALIVLFAIFCGIVSSKGYRLDMYIKIVFNEGIVLSIVATGAIFIYTLGSFDISLGAATLFAATLGVMTYNATENIGWMILVIMLAGIGCSLLNSVLASIFHIPVFVTTVAMILPLLFMGQHNIPRNIFPFVFHSFMILISILFVLKINVKKLSMKGVLILFTIGAIILLGYLKMQHII